MRLLNIILSALLTADVRKQCFDARIPPQSIKPFHHKTAHRREMLRELWRQVSQLFLLLKGRLEGTDIKCKNFKALTVTEAAC